MQRICVWDTDSLMKSGKSTDSFMFSGKRYRFFAEIRRAADGTESVETLYATRCLILLESSLIFLLLFLENSIEDQGCNQKNDQV